MKCQNCGAENPEGARFCNKCGGKILSEHGRMKQPQPDFTPLSGAPKQQEKTQHNTKKQDGLRREPPKDKKKWWLIPVIAAIAAGVLALGFLLKPQDSQSDSILIQTPTEQERVEETKENIRETVCTEPEIQETAAPAPVEENKNPVNPEELILKNFDPMGKSPYVFGTKLRKADIEAVTFYDSLRMAPVDAVDVSREGSGRVLLWSGNGNHGRQIYIAGDGKVFLPEDCNFLFGAKYDDSKPDNKYEILKKIDFNGAVDTSLVQNMSAMFQFSGSLQKLDLRDFDTSSVTDMSYMFCGCKSLQNLDVSSFQTGNVENMSTMFNGCESLENLDISNFDTRNVSLMTWMFGNCRGLTLLDLSDMRTDSVRFNDTGCMFKGCTEYFQIITNDSILRNRYEVFLEKLPD